MIAVLLIAGMIAAPHLSVNDMVGQAWNHLSHKDYQQCRVMAQKAYRIVGDQADKMQVEILKGRAYDYRHDMALNLAGECLYLTAFSYDEEGDFEEAEGWYQALIDRYPDAMTGWPGWIWSPAETAKERIKGLAEKNTIKRTPDS